MKRFIFALFLCLFSVSVFAEPLTDVLGINFTDSKKEVIKKMKKEKWKIEKENDDFLQFADGKSIFYNLPVKRVLVSYLDDTMYFINITVKPDTQADYDNARREIFNKYNCTHIERETKQISEVKGKYRIEYNCDYVSAITENNHKIVFSYVPDLNRYTIGFNIE